MEACCKGSDLILFPICRPRGSFLSTLLSSSYSGGPVTSSSQPQLRLAFTEPVAGLSAASFNVTTVPDAVGGEVQSVQRANGTDGSIFTLQLALPPSYLGGVTVNMVVRPHLWTSEMALFVPEADFCTEIGSCLWMTHKGCDRQLTQA